MRTMRTKRTNKKDGSLNSLKIPLALASALLLSWISMHWFLLSQDMSITASELEGRTPQDYLAHLKRAIGLSLFATLAAQLLIAWTLGHAMCGPLRRPSPMIRYALALVAGMVCTAILVFISLYTGGALVDSSLEHALKAAVSTI